jgi:C1A family cysteine protease
MYQVEEPLTLPSSVDLTASGNLTFPIYDQGQLGSCTANAGGGAIQAEMRKQGEKDWTPSRLFIYYNTRAIEGTTSYDSGGQIRDVFKTINSQGYAPESEWPYDISKFAKCPPKSVYTDASNTKVIQYLRVNQDLNTMKSCLAAGYPFVFGISVYDSFEEATDGVIPMPDPNNESLLGGHALLCVGYNDQLKRFKFRNSWAQSWGMEGYGTIPYDYLSNPNLGSDYWTIRLES